MNKGILIIAVLCCFLFVSGSIGGSLYWKRCDLDLVDCPSPGEETETETETEKVMGCMNENATNYSPSATEDDGSCIIKGCMWDIANNYVEDATIDDPDEPCEIDNGVMVPRVSKVCNSGNLSDYAHPGTIIDSDGAVVIPLVKINLGSMSVPVPKIIIPPDMKCD